jgi:hypothetical protein
VRLYERLGCARENPNSEKVILLSEQTRQQFAISDSPAERYLASQQGKLARKII